MTQEQWSKLKYFNRAEAWGEPDRMSHELLVELDLFRGFIGQPITVTCGTQGQHVPGSFHYDGLAADLVFPGCKPSDLLDLMLAASRFKFGGIGLYPYWRCNGVKTGGMHVDMRPWVHDRAYWMGISSTRPSGKSVTQYVQLSRQSLFKHGIIGVLG